MYQSETSKFRNLLAKYCVGNGVDIGFGGDPIVPTAITIDLENPYSKTGNAPQNLKGDGRNLYWFKDGSLDYVYSSHLLEDFEDTEKVLKEWIRLIRPGGHLILLLPDEQRFRKHCSKTGMRYNNSHKHADFSLEKVRNLLISLGVKIAMEQDKLMYAPEESDYNFAIVAKKA